MKKIFYPARSIFLGLLISQVIGTVHVYLSNLALARKIEALLSSGYLVIPNPLVRPTLLEIKSAIYGGMFFTLSLGAGLSVAAVAAAWFYDRIGLRRKIFLWMILLLWVLSLLTINSNGLTWTAAAFLVLVPVPVFLLTLRIMPPKNDAGMAFGLAFALPFILLGVIWAPLADKNVFIGVRDNLLWSTAPGRWLSDAYYHNTLYAAESFKSLGQKTLKTVRISQDFNRAETRSLQKILISHDYLPLNSDQAVDLTVTRKEKILIFKHQGQPVLDVSWLEFFRHPTRDLEDFSKRTDRYHKFRRATFFAVLAGSTPAMYVVFFSFFQWALGLVMAPKRSAAWAGTICFTLMLGLLTPILLHRLLPEASNDINDLLISQTWTDQVTGLKKIVDQKGNVTEYPVFRSLAHSPSIPVRYWLATALGSSPSPEAQNVLLELLEDPQLNVVCMAVKSLGQSHQRKWIPEIMKVLNNSPHWYVQWYAYRALRSLKWRQSRSI